MPYVYKITNLINNKLYIGKTSLPTVQQRMKIHIQDSLRRRYQKRPLYDAFLKYGIKNFSIEILEEVKDDNQASQRQVYWINKLRTYIGFKDCNGYNATLGGDSRRLYDYKELADAYLKLGTEKAVCEKYHCDRLTVLNACNQNNIKVNYKPKRKKIRRIDSNGNEKIYNSITEAAKDIPNKALETARKNISRGLNHHTAAYGYIFQQYI